jgi:hypothetical protein
MYAGDIPSKNAPGFPVLAARAAVENFRVSCGGRFFTLAQSERRYA